MLDAKYIKDNLQKVANKLATRGFELDINLFETQQAQKKDLQEKTQKLQSQRKTISKENGKGKAKGKDADNIFAKVNEINEELKIIESFILLWREKKRKRVPPLLPRHSFRRICKRNPFSKLKL